MQWHENIHAFNMDLDLDMVVPFVPGCSLFKYDYCVLCILFVWRFICFNMVFGVGFDFGFCFWSRSWLCSLSASAFFGFRINDWPYYMYNSVNATNMLHSKESHMTHLWHVKKKENNNNKKKK